MPYYELEQLLDDLKELAEEEEEERKKKEGATPSMSLNSMARQMKPPNLSIPKLPNFNM